MLLEFIFKIHIELKNTTCCKPKEKRTKLPKLHKSHNIYYVKFNIIIYCQLFICFFIKLYELNKGLARNKHYFHAQTEHIHLKMFYLEFLMGFIRAPAHLQAPAH